MARSTLTTTTPERPYVSKTKFLSGSQCRKLLWYAYNATDQIPEPDAAQQAIFDQGHEVGALAKSLYLGSIGERSVTSASPVMLHSSFLLAFCIVAIRALVIDAFVVTLLLSGSLPRSRSSSPTWCPTARWTSESSIAGNLDSSPVLN